MLLYQELLVEEGQKNGLCRKDNVQCSQKSLIGGHQPCSQYVDLYSFYSDKIVKKSKHLIKKK